MKDNDTITAREAAQRLGLSESTIRRACWEGRLPARKSAGTWLVSWEAARSYPWKRRKVLTG